MDGEFMWRRRWRRTPSETPILCKVSSEDETLQQTPHQQAGALLM
jgi:hypothetical protein